MGLKLSEVELNKFIKQILAHKCTSDTTENIQEHCHTLKLVMVAIHQSSL